MEDMTPPEERNRDVQPSLLLATVVSASQTSVPEGKGHSSHLTLLGRYNCEEVRMQWGCEPQQYKCVHF